MTFRSIVDSAQEHMTPNSIDGWLLYDYQKINPIFWETVGQVPNVTRPCWLWIPSMGSPILLVSYVDQGRFSHLDIPIKCFVSRAEMTEHLSNILNKQRRILMEYSPSALLPRVSRVDAGTIELIKSFGVEVLASSDIIQYATQRWSDDQLQSHISAAGKLSSIVEDAFDYIGSNLSHNPRECEVADFVRNRASESGLVMSEGPVVAVNQHSSDPHFAPTERNSNEINIGDWVLIDLWARLSGNDTMFADITWTGFVGSPVPQTRQKIFDIVIGARDAALISLEQAFKSNRTIQGWEVDRVARDYISQSGYGDYFSHRLGHSLGREAHGNAVNLDSWETKDTRPLIPGVAVTIEPGIYLPEFGVRSEINIFMSGSGPQVTSRIQKSVVKIGV